MCRDHASNAVRIEPKDRAVPSLLRDRQCNRTPLPRLQQTKVRGVLEVWTYSAHSIWSPMYKLQGIGVESETNVFMDIGSINNIAYIGNDMIHE